VPSIRLPRGTWLYDDSRPLAGPGGFGQVFEGADLGGGVVAVKRLNIDATQSGFREVEIIDACAMNAIA